MHRHWHAGGFEPCAACCVQVNLQTTLDRAQSAARAARRKAAKIPA
jgi:hypothetical protein